MSTHLAELRQAADLADDDRRAIGRIPEVLREPAAAAAAWERWEAAHETLTAARREAGLEEWRPASEHRYRAAERPRSRTWCAVAAAMQTSHADPGWRTAWEHVDATGDNHLRAVQREGQQASRTV